MLKSHRRTMAPTNKYWRARPTTSDIWDRTHKKLAVMGSFLLVPLSRAHMGSPLRSPYAVLEVDDSIAQEKLVCTLRVGKLEQKSHKVSNIAQC